MKFLTLSLCIALIAIGAHYGFLGLVVSLTACLYVAVVPRALRSLWRCICRLERRADTELALSRHHKERRRMVLLTNNDPLLMNVYDTCVLESGKFERAFEPERVEGR